MMESRVYLMWLDLDSDARPDPFYLFLLALLSLILLLQLFVKFLNVVHLLGVDRRLIFELPFKIISGVEG
jgi:uncharacterized membrane protein